MIASAAARQPALHAFVRRASRRLRWILVWRLGSRGACAAAWIGIAWVAAARFRVAADPALWRLAVLLLAGLTTGALFGALVRLSPAQVARWADERTGMQDRFATAWELSCSERRAEPATSSTLARLQSDDASAHATSVDMREAFPARPRSDLLVLLPSLAVLAATVWLPDLPLFWSESRRKEMNQVAARATHLAKLADQAEKTASKGRLPETRKAASAARRLSSDMKRGMGKKEALVRLNKLTQRLEAQQRRLAAATAGAGKPLASAAMAAQKALQEKPTDAGAGKSGMPRPSQSMDKAQSALKDFAGAVGSRDFEGQNKALQKLADELASGGMSAQELGKLGAQLEQLAKALKGTELDKASQELAELAKQLKAFALDPKTLKDLEKLTAQLRELAKDPEFLKKLAKLAKQAGGT